ncbi:MAG TPA: methylated-DNA--[protein]-cysteine S-methyltransferase [Steroidobacteraceae bacterium]
MTRATVNFLDSRDFDRIARAIHFVQAHFREQPRLATVAAQAGLSEFHFNRLFRRWAGVTPKQYLAYVTGNAARQALRRLPVLDAAYAVGLSGPGRLHDLIIRLDAMTPGELKLQGAGTAVRFGFTPTPFGTALIASTPRGVCHLAFLEAARESDTAHDLAARWPRAELRRDDAHALELAKQIWRTNAGANAAPRPMHVSVPGTNFQLKVWRALLDLGGAGNTTYTALADAIGQPAAARAVGLAVGANPVAWLIPCHRVLRKDGGLGGYHWGEERKGAMLAFNALRAPDGISHPQAVNGLPAHGRLSMRSRAT